MRRGQGRGRRVQPAAHAWRGRAPRLCGASAAAHLPLHELRHRAHEVDEVLLDGAAVLGGDDGGLRLLREKKNQHCRLSGDECI